MLTIMDDFHCSNKCSWFLFLLQWNKLEYANKDKCIKAHAISPVLTDKCLPSLETLPSSCGFFLLLFLKKMNLSFGLQTIPQVSSQGPSNSWHHHLPQFIERWEQGAAAAEYKKVCSLPQTPSLHSPLLYPPPTFSLSPRIPGWLLFLFFFLSSTLPTSLASPLLQVPLRTLEKYASLTPALSHSVISLGGHFGMGLPGTPLTLHATELYFIMLVPKALGSSPGACASHGPNSHTGTLRPTQCHLQQLHFMAHRSLATPSTNNKFFRFLPLTVPLLY